MSTRVRSHLSQGQKREDRVRARGPRARAEQGGLGRAGQKQSGPEVVARAPRFYIQAVLSVQYLPCLQLRSQALFPKSRTPAVQCSAVAVQCWPSQATPAVCIAKREGRVEISPSPWSAVGIQTLKLHPHRWMDLLLSYLLALHPFTYFCAHSLTHFFSTSSTLAVCILSSSAPNRPSRVAGHI